MHIIQKFITRALSHIKHESEARASHQVARRSVLIVNELGYEMRLKWRLKLYRDEQFLMEVGMEFHVAGEL